MRTREDLVAYLLGELGPDERERFEHRLARDEGLRREAEALRGVVGGLERLDPDAWDPPTPPPLRLGGAGPASQPGRASRSGRRIPRLATARTVLAALSLVGLGLVLGLLVAPDAQEPAPAGPRVVLAPVGRNAPAGEGIVRLDAARTRATVRVSGLPPSRAGEFYELWLLGERGALISIAAFRVPASGAAELAVPLPADPGRFAFIDLSLEAVDGDPGHSARSILRGPSRPS